MIFDKKQAVFLKRKARNTYNIKQVATRPRLRVFRSGNHTYAQVICHITGNIIAAASTVDKELRSKLKTTSTVEAANAVGELVAKRSKEKNIIQVMFDRSGYPYHGRVKAVAEGARNSGLDF